MALLKVAGPRLAAVRPSLVPAADDRDKRRAVEQPWRAWYSTAEWQALRRVVLQRAQWRCQQTGVLLVGRAPEPNSPVVDHIRPHRGDRALFFDLGNLQAVSKAWHDSAKQAAERRGWA